MLLILSVVVLVRPSFVSIVQEGLLFLLSKVCSLRDIRLFWIGRIPRYEHVVLLCQFFYGLLGYTVLD